MNINSWVLTLSLFFIFQGCANLSLPTQVASREEIILRDQALGHQLAQWLDTHLKFKQDIEISIYLRKLAQSLVDATPELRGSPVGVWLIGKTHGKWRSYGLPGNRIYLSVGILRSIQFENEIAAMIAIQFGHILKKHVADSNAADQVDDIGPEGIFNFSEEAEISAMRTAVGILYRAGFDSRGLISLYKRFNENPSYSPYEMSTINKLIEHAQHEIAVYAPLRNPIVRSEDFFYIQKRIQSL